MKLLLGQPVCMNRLSLKYLTIFLLWLFPCVASIAQWSEDPAINTPVSVWEGSRYVEDAISDGEGGAFIAWVDETNFSPNILVFVQRISKDGKVLWDEAGVRVALTFHWQAGPRMCSDEAGGVIVVWQDSRFNSNDLFAQRLSPTGQRLWGNNGTPICLAFDAQTSQNITSDKMGGAVVAWRDLRYSVAGDIFAQRINSAGVVQWATNGVPVCAVSGTQGDVDVVKSNNNGFFVVWNDTRPGETYIQYLDDLGNPQWALNGIRVCLSGACTGNRPKVIPDNGSGALVLWVSGGIRIQQISASGQLLWGGDGILALDKGFTVNVVPDGKGGLLFCTEHFTPSLNRTDIYAQRVSHDGTLPWGSAGIAICTTHTADINRPQICIDDESGAIITWGDLRNDSIDVYAQRIDSNGVVQWMQDGLPISLASRDQQYPFAISDLKGGSIITWANDSRNGGGAFGQVYYDIFAQNIDRYGNLGITYPEITGITDTPLDQGGFVNISWRACSFDRDSLPLVASYSVFRKADSGSPWLWVANVPASSETSYTYSVPTAFDSTSASSSVQHFLVQALNNDSSMHWNSFADSGYSVDNLAPSPPVSLTAVLQPDSNVTLSWPPNAIDPDVLGYRVFKSESTNVSLPVTEIGFTTDTSFIDVDYRIGTKSVYYVTAVDIHENEGSPSITAEVTTERTFSYDIQLPVWHLISLPVTVANSVKDSLFPQASGSEAYRYENGYVADDTLLQSYGYWLKFSDTDTIDIEGGYRSTDTMSVKKGWNLLGSLSEPFSAGMVTSIPGGVLTSNFYAYTPPSGYSTVDTLYPGKGHWLKVSQDAEIILSGETITQLSSNNRIHIRQTEELPPPPPSGEQVGYAYLQGGLPAEFKLMQNVPNPFNPVTTISYQLPVESYVTMTIFNVLGEEVAVIAEGIREAGTQSLTWNATHVPSGMYFLRMQAVPAKEAGITFVDTKKMVLMK